MSYRIEYDRRVGKFEVHRERRYWYCVLGAAALFLLVTLCFWPAGAQAFRAVLIPGEDAVTAQAFRTMTDDLRSGAPVGEAVEAFCRYVIHGQPD